MQLGALRGVLKPTQHLVEDVERALAFELVHDSVCGERGGQHGRNAEHH